MEVLSKLIHQNLHQKFKTLFPNNYLKYIQHIDWNIMLIILSCNNEFIIIFSLLFSQRDKNYYTFLVLLHSNMIFWFLLILMCSNEDNHLLQNILLVFILLFTNFKISILELNTIFNGLIIIIQHIF